MDIIFRDILPILQSRLDKGRSVLLLGPRQTGKTTMLKTLSVDMFISFIQPRVRLRYEKDPSLLADEVSALVDIQDRKPLVIVDEVQKVPLIMDVVQALIDDGIAQFTLTGSSARKLKHGSQINLLPGRVIPMHMSPLSIHELPAASRDLEQLLIYGSLPEIVTTCDLEDKEERLHAYVSLYLEEEVRMEALVRNVGNFARFLELAASESGLTVNFSKLSQVVGVASSTIADYYQILEDCLIVERIEPYLQSKTRHRLSKSQKYIFFDLGLRRVAAQEGRRLPLKQMGLLFEQFVGLELLKLTHTMQERMRLKYWCDLNGPEVDWLLEATDKLIPIEVKYTDRPSKADAKHLITFMQEYESATQGYIVCRAPQPIKITDHVLAIPWQMLACVVGI